MNAISAVMDGAAAPGVCGIWNDEMQWFVVMPEVPDVEGSLSPHLKIQTDLFRTDERTSMCERSPLGESSPHSANPSDYKCQIIVLVLKVQKNRLLDAAPITQHPDMPFVLVR